MKKQIISALLAGCMIISLVGCNKNTNKKEDNTTGKTETSINYATYDYFNKLMGRKENVNGSTLYKYADFIELGDYKGVEAEVDSSTKIVSDESFDSALTNVLASHATTNKITSGTTKDGDSINLDFKGLLDGEAFENGTSTDYSYTIGGSFIDDLDRGLIGLEVGKQYSIPCKFPDDYGKEELNGKDVVFEVTVNYINETVYPDLTDELAKTIATEQNLTDFDTAEGLKSYLRSKLEEQAESTFKDEKFTSAWKNVLANCKFNGMPEVDYQSAYDSMVANAKQSFSQFETYGYTWEQFLNMYSFETEDDFNKYCEDTAKEYVQTKLAVMAIADKEGFTVSEDEYKECAQYYVDNYSYDSLDALLEAIGDESKDAFIEERYYEVVYGKVYDLVLENCKEVEKN